MIASMTGFSRQTAQSAWGSLIWELRSVNHRFLDVSIRLPETLRSLEPLIREKISEKLQRGKVEAYLKFVPGADSPFQLKLNQGLIKQLTQTCQTIQGHLKDSQIDVLGLLAWPGVLETENSQLQAISTEALQLLQITVDDFQLMRQREGGQLKDFIERRLESILKIIEGLEKQIPQLLLMQRDRMLARFTELSIPLDPQRTEQEMAILIQKTDVAEEIQRIISHCSALLQALSEPGGVGRRLDFLTQELHREANTLGSKALSISVTQASVELKVLIEQIREQVQNIE